MEMARAYAARGIEDFSRALWERWKEGDAQVEGRPDAAAETVSIITMHSAKGLEWPGPSGFSVGRGRALRSENRSPS